MTGPPNQNNMSETKAETQRGHYTSASSAQADTLCPGRHLAQQGIVEPEGTEKAEWAAEGQKVHEALRKQDPTGLSAAQTDLYERCNQIHDTLRKEWLKNVPVGQIKTVREQRYWVGAGGLKHSGQVDVADFCGNQVLIVDFKSLAGEVPESPTNMQLRDQAVLLWLNRPLTKHVAVAIIQPYVTMTPQYTVYGEPELERALSEMERRVKNSNDPNAKRVPGDIQCNYCKAKSQCVEYQQWAGSKVPVPVSIIDVPVSQWTPEQRAVFCENAGRAQKWLDEGWNEMKRLAQADPNAIPGWVIEPGKVKHPINDAQQCYERCSVHGVTLDTFMKCINVKKTDLKDAVKEASKLKGKALNTAWEAVEAGITDTKQDAPSLAKVKTS